jgi:VIT1/CCC1 family predicted Fe2+/Mn2+ transporter
VGKEIIMTTNIDYDALLAATGTTPVDNSALIAEFKTKIQKIDSLLPTILADRQETNDLIAKAGGTPVPLTLPALSFTPSNNRSILARTVKLQDAVKANSWPFIGLAVGFGIGLIILILGVNFIENIQGGFIAVLVIVMLLLAIAGLALGTSKKQAHQAEMAKNTNHTS